MPGVVPGVRVRVVLVAVYRIYVIVKKRTHRRLFYFLPRIVLHVAYSYITTFWGVSNGRLYLLCNGLAG